MCSDVMGKSRIAYSEKSLRQTKSNFKLLTDAMELYRDNANDYAFTIMENFLLCKNNYMYAFTKRCLIYKSRAKK